ncbi:helix-turn-helix domain-containing protein [Lentzea sp. NPDC058450]|uniref:helix-turn-helix domain-containing protein n=1 Tax=Lentzea sp. NPDC058450 TaxID=3346505 RepID=UPI003667B062
MTTGGRTELGVDLDELRLLVGLSYRELARRTGCARSTLHDALTGRRFPRLDTVLAIATACGGDTARWRLRWVAACKRSHVPRTEATTSLQSTSPS